MTDETKPMPDEIYIEYPDGCIWWHKNVGSMTKYTRADLTQPQGETIEALIEKAKTENEWFSLDYRRETGQWRFASQIWVYGSGPTPAEAIKSALNKADG